MKTEQAINIAKGCVMASAMDNETKMAVLEMLNLVAIPKTETTDCEWCKSFDRFEFNPIDHDGNCIPDEYCMVQSGLAAYCPNCGRKIGED